MAKLGDIESAVAVHEQVVDVPIMDPSEEPYTGPDGEPCTIGVIGRESKEYRAAESKWSRQVLNARRTKLTPEQVTEGRIFRAAAVVKRFSGWENGKAALEFNPDNVKALLSVPHILEQVEDGIQAPHRFFGNASTS